MSQLSGRELDVLPREQLAQVVAFQSEQIKRYQKLVIDGRVASVRQVAREAPELCVVDLREVNPDRLWEEYQEHEATFDSTPFDPFGQKFRLYPGGITIWSGQPGTGKTTLLRQLICHLLKRGRGVFVASLEEPPSHMLCRLWMTAAGTLTPDYAQRDAFMHAYGQGKLRMWGERGLADASAVFDTMRYGIEEGCSHAVIDSLTCLNIGDQEFDAQRGFVHRICGLAAATQAHIHLVAHPRKPQKADAAPDISEVAGSSALGRLVDNVVFVRRDLDGESDDFSKPTGMQIVIRKQRHGTGYCGKLQGYLNRQTRQFSLEQYAPAERYLPEDRE